MKKILIVNDGFPPQSWGGANTIAYLHAKAMLARGYDVRVLATTQNKETDGVYVYEGISVECFFSVYHDRWWAYKSLHNRDVVPHFTRILREFKPDVVHFHNIHHYFSYRCISIAKQSGARVFLTAHDVMSFAYQKLHYFIDYTDKAVPTNFSYRLPWWGNFADERLRFNPLRNYIIRRRLKLVDQIFAVSGELKQALVDNGIYGNVSVVHNGLDPASFGLLFDGSTLRQKLKLGDEPIVLFVGRFTPAKGRDVLLHAFAEVRERLPVVKLLVVGFDPVRNPEASLNRLLDDYRLREHVVFVASSPHHEIFQYYRIADIVVTPSIIFDSFPTVNLEAMAAGKPVISTCFGGSREAVVNGLTGYIVNPLNTNDLTSKIEVLLRDKTLAWSMGNEGKKRLCEKFSLEHQMNSYIRFYSDEPLITGAIAT